MVSGGGLVITCQAKQVKEGRVELLGSAQWPSKRTLARRGILGLFSSKQSSVCGSRHSSHLLGLCFIKA